MYCVFTCTQVLYQCTKMGLSVLSQRQIIYKIYTVNLNAIERLGFMMH